MTPPRNRHTEGDEPEQVLYVDHPTEVGQTVRIEGPEADHAKRSLRIRSGDAVHLVDGRGFRYPGRVSDLGKRSLQISVLGKEPVPVWPARSIWLGAGILRSTRMDFVVEKASELGVSRLVPLDLERCVAHPSESGEKIERWRRIAVESLKQCKRSRLMEVADPCGLEAFLDSLPEPRSLWLADPKGSPPDRGAGNPGTLVCVVGPEGGLAPEETRHLVQRGGSPVALGGHRLRAETAVLTLVTAALVTLSEMGPAPSTRP